MIRLFTLIVGLILCTYNVIVVLTVSDSVDNHLQPAEFTKLDSCHDNEELELDRYSQVKNDPIIRTNIGNVHGQFETFNDVEAAVYYGIRYAKPPVGALRFTKPVPMDSDAIETFGLQSAEKVSCVQPENFLTKGALNVSEDCLHLNIWVPLSQRHSNDKHSNRLPVMIWIHGGSFHMGSAHQDEFNGITLASIGQVIVVTFNYRLGFFGFLNAGLSSVSGNMGLYDQVAALSFVRDNIYEFGGDPTKVTVFGESAGALSVGLLIVSPLTRNLFQRAILESGSPYSPLRPERKASVFAKSLLFSKAMNCSHPDDIEFSVSAMDCLRHIDYKVIDDYGRTEVMHSQILPNPIFGDEFIPSNVHHLMKDPANVNEDLEVMIGINRDEGFVFVYQQLRHLLTSSSIGSKEMAKDEVHSIISELLKGRQIDPVGVTNFYFKNMTSNWDSMKVLDTIIDLYGDLYVNCPVYYLAKRFNEILGHERTYSYMLTEACSQPYIPPCKEWSQVCHGDELLLIFGVPLRRPELFTDTDAALSKHMLGLWTDFARTGKVNWTNHPNNWFADVPLAKVRKFHPEKTYACEAFWREIFESQFELMGEIDDFLYK